MPNTSIALPDEFIEDTILLIRGKRVILDHDLARLYGVAPRVLNQAVKRNLDRFPEDFMFQLSDTETVEWQRLRSQIGSLNARFFATTRTPAVLTNRTTFILVNQAKAKNVKPLPEDHDRCKRFYRT
jgi:ORF6N domain